MLSTLAADEWIQNRRRNRSFAVLWAGLAMGLSVVLVVFFVKAIGNSQWTGVLAILVVFGSLALYPAWYAYGAARAGLRVTHQEVLVRNPFRSHAIPLANVGEFVAGLQPARGFFSAGGNPTPGILLKTKDGRTYPVWTLAREGLVWNSEANAGSWDGVAESLNHLVDSLR